MSDLIKAGIDFINISFFNAFLLNFIQNQNQTHNPDINPNVLK